MIAKCLGVATPLCCLCFALAISLRSVVGALGRIATFALSKLNVCLGNDRRLGDSDIHAAV